MTENQSNSIGIQNTMNVKQMGVPGLCECDVIVGQDNGWSVDLKGNGPWYAMPCDGRLTQWYDSQEEAESRAVVLTRRSNGKVAYKLCAAVGSEVAR